LFGLCLMLVPLVGERLAMRSGGGCGSGVGRREVGRRYLRSAWHAGGWMFEKAVANGEQTEVFCPGTASWKLSSSVGLEASNPAWLLCLSLLFHRPNEHLTLKAWQCSTVGSENRSVVVRTESLPDRVSTGYYAKRAVSRALTRHQWNQPSDLLLNHLQRRPDYSDCRARRIHVSELDEPAKQRYGKRP
jgi:hypothetical protein